MTQNTNKSFSNGAMEDKEINLLPINKRLTTPLPPFLLNIDPKIKFEIITPVDTPV